LTGYNSDAQARIGGV